MELMDNIKKPPEALGARRKVREGGRGSAIGNGPSVSNLASRLGNNC
jgi:hypothetical protein